MIDVGELSFRFGVGTLTAKSLGSSRGQAMTYVAVDLAAREALSLYLEAEYPNILSSKKQLITADIACRVVGCVSGIAATCLICDKPIGLLGAFLVQVATHDVANFFIFKVSKVRR